jgi:cell division protein FtsB
MSAIPISRTSTRTAPRRRAKRRTYISTKEIISWSAVFSVIVLVVFGTSSLAGHVLVESARRQSIQANQRMRTAVAAQNALAREIEDLSDDQLLSAWASRNGFVATDLFVHPSGRNDAVVARR